jgi:hypothetical protein
MLRVVRVGILKRPETIVPGGGPYRPQCACLHAGVALSYLLPRRYCAVGRVPYGFNISGFSEKAALMKSDSDCMRLAVTCSYMVLSRQHSAHLE